MIRWITARVITAAGSRQAAAAAGLADFFEALLSVEAAGVYKPAPAAYRVVTDHFGCAPEAGVAISGDTLGLTSSSAVDGLAGAPCA